MTLTSEHLEQLKAPFAPAEHEFIRGMAYIREDAITNRIEEIDPAWHFRVEQVIDRDGSITVVGSMTILGVTRENTGMATVQMTKDGNNEANEAEKSATTDALKRCARLFGVGRYLLSLPNNVRDERSLAGYLGGDAQSVTKQSTTKAPTKQTPTNGNGNSESSGDYPKPADGDIKATTVTEFEVRKSKKNTTYMVFTTSDGEKATCWHSWDTAFGEYGWDKNNTDHVVKEAENKYRLPIPVPVKITGNNGFWNLLEVTDSPDIVQKSLADASVDF